MTLAEKIEHQRQQRANMEHERQQRLRKLDPTPEHREFQRIVSDLQDREVLGRTFSVWVDDSGRKPRYGIGYHQNHTAYPPRAYYATVREMMEATR